jgi:hypothetical protein
MEKIIISDEKPLQVDELEKIVSTGEAIKNKDRVIKLEIPAQHGNKDFVYELVISNFRYHSKFDYVDGLISLTKYEVTDKEKTVVEWQGLKPIGKKVPYKKYKKIWGIHTGKIYTADFVFCGEIINNQFSLTYDMHSKPYKKEIRKRIDSLRIGHKKIQLTEKFYELMFNEADKKLLELYKEIKKTK